MRVFLVAGFIRDAEMVFGARACFVERRTILRHPKDKRFGTPYFAVYRYFPEARKKQLDRVTTRGCGNYGGLTNDKG